MKIVYLKIESISESRNKSNKIKICIMFMQMGEYIFFDMIAGFSHSDSGILN